MTVTVNPIVQPYLPLSEGITLHMGEGFTAGDASGGTVNIQFNLAATQKSGEIWIPLWLECNGATSGQIDLYRINDFINDAGSVGNFTFRTAPDGLGGIDQAQYTNVQRFIRRPYVVRTVNPQLNLQWSVNTNGLAYRAKLWALRFQMADIDREELTSWLKAIASS